MSSSPREYRCERLDGVDNRQSGIAGFDQAAFGRAVVLFVGSGGLGGEAASGLVRMGIGTAYLCDGDRVEVSNLNRQQFGKGDLGKNKALRLARWLRCEGFHGTRIVAIPFYLQEAQERGLVPGDANLVVNGVDNHPSRERVVRSFHGKVPVVHASLSPDSEHGLVVVEDLDGACYRCVLPSASKPDSARVRCAAAAADLVKIAGGWMVYAAQTLLMARARTWNLKVFYLAGGVPDVTARVPRRENCPWCGGR